MVNVETYYRLPQVLEHETKGGRSVRHGIRTVQDDEAIKIGVVQFYVGGDSDPVCTKTKRNSSATWSAEVHRSGTYR